MMAPDYDKKVPEFEKAPESDKKYLKKAGGHIDRNVALIFSVDLRWNENESGRPKHMASSKWNKQGEVILIYVANVQITIFKIFFIKFV